MKRYFWFSCAQKKQILGSFLSLLGSVLLGVPGVAASPLPAVGLAPDLQAVVDELEFHGFQVSFAEAPNPRVWGLFLSSTKTLWVTPAAFHSGANRQTFLHEAAHAAQSCPSGLLTLIGWKNPLPEAAESALQALLVSSYPPQARPLEAEARRLAERLDAPQQLLEALRRRCGGGQRPRPVPGSYRF